ncbi:MAG: hypothetical protein PHI45_00860 [Candidatus Pacebacteria bacterium]|nr:hypothetical protein [Candidatus Paceibacterota bacterium]MDD5013339.1 hypothetical protein [Candidatus Paceibacterota bacterium]MDD5752627.1 hypothetical protein [Candidatus Paceibacterota bacterium]
MKVAILGHLLTKKDLRKLFPFGKYLPLSLMEFLINIYPKKFSLMSEFDILGKAKGYLLGIHLTSEQIMNNDKDKIKNIILETILYAQNKLNCDIVMLGALTAPATSAGLWLKTKNQIKLGITTGNTYTAAVAIQATEKAIDLAGLNLDNIKIAIVGSAGVIGEAVVKYFNKKNANLILVERSLERFDRLKNKLQGKNFELTDNLKNIINADVLITATSHPEALITGDLLKKNAIVIDVAEPSDVVSDIKKIRPDVISIDGGRVKWNKININFKIGLPSNVGFACMTEGMMQALEEDKNDYIGSVDMNHLEDTINWAKKWGFEIADFTCFNELIDLKKFKNINN